MNYFDLHCDTAYEMYTRHESLRRNTLAVDLDGFDVYEHKAQVFAIWSENTRPADTVYHDFFEILENLKKQVAENDDRAVVCTDRACLTDGDTRLKVIPAVEGARILENDLTRLEALRERGVRILTLAWEGESPVCGAYDTDTGLTEFGYRVVEHCEELGILVDVSHLSEKGFWEVANVAKKPFLATHSNARALCDHPRNLSDTQIRTVVSQHGLIGASLVGRHLSKALQEGLAKEDTFVGKEALSRHLVHMIERAGAKNLCFGCDWDGTDPLAGLERVGQLASFGTYMTDHGAPQELVDDLFYGNAYRFFAENL